ncbi:MAG: elongation factor P maturation arginine rhamnosyltransferase EarP [Zoogloea sp.]|nr:elongation factor P maturation arginine rhamnosyltransferase EarP [Zoogloea sp.]
MAPVEPSSPASFVTASPGERPVWDMFCKVVDNFGDIGVCWRLARQLVAEHGLAVRLWVDDLACFARLAPALDADLAVQEMAGVSIRRWREPFPQSPPGEVVIGAFACEIPPAFMEAMASRKPRSLWINLEYLSAEDWVAGCHGLPSPHPRLPLVQHFFFPGFVAGTGGVPCERDLEAGRRAFVDDPQQVAAYWAALGLPPRVPGELRVSLFCYENPALPELIAAWRDGPVPVTCLLPEGRALPQMAAALALPSLSAEQAVRCGALAVHVLPFVEQDAYDRLLWACDLNFVRGEDSFVRAQLAARPLVWHIYPQDDDAHHAKLEAFMELHASALDLSSRQALSDFWRAWNTGEGVAATWPAFVAALPSLEIHALAWRGQLASLGGLAANLVLFCKHLVQ